jgi:hypothetical protein
MNVEGRIHMAIKVFLDRLTCITTETYHGPDKAYLLYNGVRITDSHKINDAETWELDLLKDIVGTATVDLFDDDELDPDDYLGRAEIHASELNLGLRSKDIKGDDAHYTLYYSVVDVPV